jgi:phage FluMu protein Com
MKTMSYSSTPVCLRTSCENCHRAVELECEGIAGPAGYETYSEYVCPSCRKLNRVKTPGNIISTRPTS